MSCYIRGGTTRHSDDTMDDDTDDKDDTRRKSRNLSEKKRRDQFNMLVNELGSMVSNNTRKMDKSTVLKSTISFLKNHNEIAVRSRAHEIQEDWKPSFLSNEEFTHLILEALDGFIIVFSCNDGRIFYTSQNVTSLLGYLSADLANTSIYDIAYQEDQTLLYNVLGNHSEAQDRLDHNEEKQVSFSCHIKIGGLDFRDEPVYELVQFVGYFRSDVDVDPDMENFIQNDRHDGILTNDSKLVFVGTGRLQTPQLIREMSVVDNTKSEFTSRHSLEWKFLFLDHRAPPIIGYLPIEVLGTSGYDYYHVDDLDEVVTCHEALMQKGEGTSCHYRFLTKGQQWIWLQSRFYITYNQWNSKPEFVVCTHRVVSYGDVIKQLRKDPEEYDRCQNVDAVKSPSIQQQRQVASSQSGLAASSWSSRSSRTSRSVATTSRPRCHGGPGSDTTSVSAGSQSSKYSHQTLQNLRPKDSQSVTGLSTGSSRAKPQPQPQPQPELGQCVGFLEPPQYVAAIPVQPIITTSFAAPATPAVLSPLQTNEQSIVMSPAQNQMQDELQRKHEELQQLIVHQQEELRRVSEQLFFARYGILSPLINVSMPSTPPCSQAVRCVSSTTNSAQHPMCSPGIQGVSVMPVPITVSVPVVSTELFAHPLAVSPLPTVASPSQYNITRLTSVQQSGNNSNPNVSQQQQQMQQHLQHQEQQRQQSGGPITPDTAQAGPLSPELLTFQVCQQPELMFSHIRSTGSNE